MAQKPHLIMLPTPGIGHLIPLVEFAKQLVHRHHFLVTFIIPAAGPPPKAQTAILDALPNGINYVLLPPVEFHDVGIRAETQISLTVTRSLPSFRDVFNSLTQTSRVVALIVDLFGTDAFDIAKELNVSSYLFILTSATAASSLCFLPKLDQMVSCEYRDSPEPVRIPGCPVLFHGRDLPDPLQDRTDDAYKWLLHHTKRYRLADGIMLNSFVDLEPGVIKALQEEEPSMPPVYPIGPIIQRDPDIGADGSGSECLKWLEDQPKGSVLYVSFGSGGTLSLQQLNELALGLEISGQRFLWVVKSPDDKSALASYFSLQSNTDPFGFLPKGFIDRTKGRGLVVAYWAPQIRVLGHRSTGGFLTHCGWNSVLESVVNGVPMIAWPLYAEQRMNAVILGEELKVALRPKASENGVVGREEIGKVVRSLMEGEEGSLIRQRIKKLKDSAAKAVSEDGSATQSLHKLVLKWNN